MEHKAISRKRKQEEMGIYGANKKSWSDNGGIDKLPNDVLVNIVSRMSFKEAMRASVLAHRWRYLWRFFHGTLRFDVRDISTTNLMGMEKLSTVMDLHQGRHVEGVHFEGTVRGSMSHAVDDLVYFATCKEVQTLEVKLSSHSHTYDYDYDYRFIDYCTYKFPNVGWLKSCSAFSSLRALRLSRVGVTDEVVCYLVASCHSLEELCIRYSDLLKNLRVVDPPSLRALEITRCSMINSLEISATRLVSLTYGGRKSRLLLKNIPNAKMYGRIVAPPDFPQLCSLIRLELKVFTLLGRKLLFTSLIKGSPHLRELRIELSYSVTPQRSARPAFPGIISKAGRFVHRNLKVVEMAGYIGCRCAEELLLELMRKCPSIERIVIDTESDYYSDDPQLYDEGRSRGDKLTYGRDLYMRATTRNVAKERAQRFVSKIRKPIQVSLS